MVRIERILCPIDFSEFSRHAFDTAVAIAVAQRASVTAVHVAPFQAIPVFPYAERAAEEALMRSEGNSQKMADEVRRFVAVDESIGVPVTCEVRDAPNVHHEILERADSLPADLIVMGTHGRSGFQRLLLGSVTEKVLRTARQPVLTVGAASDEGAAGRVSLKRILCGFDFSDCSMAALRYAVALAEPKGVELTVLHVVEWSPIAYDPLLGPATDLAGYRIAAETIGAERLHKAVMEAAAGISVAEIVVSGRPHHEILRIAKDRQSDLIVLGIHGRNPIDRMLFGSTAEPVVRRATCPVLTVRPRAVAASAAA